MILVLTAFWALAVNHCRLEAVSDLAILTCAPTANSWDSHDHESQDCEDDGCAAIEDSLYKSNRTHVATAGPSLGRATFAEASDSDPRRPPCELMSWDSPSSTWLLAAGWQFLQRAAPPPRAPAIA